MILQAETYRGHAILVAQQRLFTHEASILVPMIAPPDLGSAAIISLPPVPFIQDAIAAGRCWVDQATAEWLQESDPELLAFYCLEFGINRRFISEI